MTIENTKQGWAEVERKAREFEVKPRLPHGTGPKLYLYWDCMKTLAWAKDPSEFRKLTGVTHGAIRTTHKLTALPDGYTLTGDGLANDPIVRTHP